MLGGGLTMLGIVSNCNFANLQIPAKGSNLIKFVYVHVHNYIYTHSMCKCVYIYVYMNIYVNMYMYIYIHVYVYVYTHYIHIITSMCVYIDIVYEYV